MKKTFRELNRFSSVVKNFINKKPAILETKFGYAIKRFEELSLTNLYQDYNSALGMVRIDHALTDKVTGALIKDPTSQRGFAYDKEGMKGVIRAEQAIEKEWAEKEFDVTPYVCKAENVPKGLTDEEIECFAGLVM